MAIAQENKYTNLIGTFPNATMIDASGIGTTDGSEFAALPLNDGWEPFQQAIMDYAAGNQNSPSGSVGVPNGIADSAGASQMLQAIQKAHGIAPGNYVPWGTYLDPSVTGDRVILLAEQGVLIATYPALDSETYVGDANNAAVAAAGGKFYRSSDSGGATPNIAGPYLQLPAQPSPTFLKQYSEANGDFTVTGTNWTTIRAVIIPYKTTNGVWRAIINIVGTVSVAVTAVTVTISGIIFKNVLNNTAALGAASSATVLAKAVVTENTGNIAFTTDGATNVAFRCSGDLELDLIPTWADDFFFKWGIRY